MKQKYDIIIKNGKVIDPSQKINSIMDIGISNGKIIEINDNISIQDGKNIIQAENKYVSPGFIDIHVHVYWGVSPWGIDVDTYCINNGVTTVVDAGSAGLETMNGFKKYIIQKSQTDVKALLNISSIGLASPSHIWEVEDIRFVDIKRTVEKFEEHNDVLVGIKIRIPQKVNRNLDSLNLALEAGDILNKPVMLDNYDYPLIPDILEMLRPGDIMTHCFHGKKTGGILSDDGKILPEIKNAVNRGIKFDVGHGSGSFDFDLVEKAFAQDFHPHTISSDIHQYNLDGPVYDFPTTLTKFLHLGLDIYDVIEKCTHAPSKILGLNSGSLKVGSTADVVVFDIKTGEYPLYGSVSFIDFNKTDSIGTKRITDKMISPIQIIKNGKILQ